MKRQCVSTRQGEGHPKPRADLQASLAIWLAHCPAFKRWKNQPLKPTLSQAIERCDQQELLSLVVQASLKLTRFPGSFRRSSTLGGKRSTRRAA